MKNVGMWTCRILLGLVGALLLFQGGMWAFSPADNLEMNSIVTNSGLGMNMIKSDIGGPLIAVGTMLLLYAISSKELFPPLMIFVSGYLLVRTVSFFVDGSHPTVLTGLIMEAVVLVLILALNKLRNSAETK